jgi:phosphatidylethanolamine/phosphatidyl-N-methylethanolamine N-methyltransferase
MTAPASDSLHFFRAWLSEPLRVAAMTPSGRALARLMTAEITPRTAPVIELGPGTGAFTRALLARGIPESRIALIELGEEFASLLRPRFPDASVLNIDAARLGKINPFNEERAGAVLSGLPLLSMSNRKVMAILAGAFKQMRPGGAFYQFTYGPTCPVRRMVLERLGLRAHHIGRTLANVPPAAVYRITRRRRHVISPVLP